MADDNPKISKHHAGQHPALKSFRAFDIIPANKVKPSHTARPVISSPVKHVDTTLAPKKAVSKSAVPEPSTPPKLKALTPDAPPTETAAATQSPVEPASSALETPELTPHQDMPELPAEQPVPDTDVQASALNADSEQAAPASASPATPAALPSEKDTDLDSILGQDDAQFSKQVENAVKPLKHTEEFQNALKEFTANQPEAKEAKPHVVIHKHDYLRKLGIGLLWLLGAAALAALVLNILLDTGVLDDFYGLPHTHFFSS